MDDDGLVLNLVDSGAGIRCHVNTKSVRWTDKVKAKRVAKRKIKPAAAQTNQPELHKKVSFADVDESPRRAKKPRTESVGDSNATSGTQKGPAHVVSSLFTSNPEIKVTPTVQRIPHDAKPSNAPLTDTSTFSGLGLDPLIVAHLEAKMNISKPTSIQRDAVPPLVSTDPEFFGRDAFIQSQTGSGKTLSFLLPILQDLLPLSSLSYIDRTIGTLAIIVAPTRELAKQISDVLESLITLRLRPMDETGTGGSSERLTRWLVSGLLVGGGTRNHEKSRIRKGLPIVVATPGRLLDHLKQTSSFNVGKCRWLVLDEADRLMELGFEESIKGILNALDGRRRLAIQAVKEGKSMEVGGWNWKRERRTILCSATMREDVQQLAGTTLNNPIVIKASAIAKPLQEANMNADSMLFNTPSEKFTPPSQLSQKYIVVHLKPRLVTLVALLRTFVAQANPRQGVKIIVFLSCTDSVDYHWKLLGGSSINEDEREDEGSDGSSDDEGAKGKGSKTDGENLSVSSPLLPNTSIYRLHGSLPLQTRLSSLNSFSKPPSSKSASIGTSSILLSTSVASRGLDLPLVRFVVQYDLPTEGGVTEYVHRVGRTARAGRGGEAWSFVKPKEYENGWVEWLEKGMRGQDKDEERATSLVRVDADIVLKDGFGGKGSEYEDRATQVQLAFERWVLKRKENTNLARLAFQSHIRAYATHPSDEKRIFNVRDLHIGHMAKAFALREAPSQIASGHKRGKQTKSGFKHKVHDTGDDNSRLKQKPSQRRVGYNADSDDDASAEKRMRDVVRKQGKLMKRDGKMMSSGTAEYQVAGLDDLEKLVARK